MTYTVRFGAWLITWEDNIKMAVKEMCSAWVVHCKEQSGSIEGKQMSDYKLVIKACSSRSELVL